MPARPDRAMRLIPKSEKISGSIPEKLTIAPTITASPPPNREIGTAHNAITVQARAMRIQTAQEKVKEHHQYNAQRLAPLGPFPGCGGALRGLCRCVRPQRWFLSCL